MHKLEKACLKICSYLGQQCNSSASDSSVIEVHTLASISVLCYVLAVNMTCDSIYLQSLKDYQALVVRSNDETTSH